MEGVSKKSERHEIRTKLESELPASLLMECNWDIFPAPDENQAPCLLHIQSAGAGQKT